MDHKTKVALLSLAFIPFVMTLGNSMLIPILPTIEKELKLTELQVSMIITLFSIVAILFIPIAGYLSDRFGRKLVILPALLITSIGGLLSGWAAWKFNNPYLWILIGRMIQGLGSAGAAPVVLPLIGDMFKDDKQVSEGLGIVESFNTFGKVLSPILGSLLAVLIWFLPFFAIPVLSVGTGLLVLFFVDSPPPNSDRCPSFQEFFKQIKQIAHSQGKWLLGVFMIGIVSMFILFGILFYLSEQLERKYGMHGVIKGLVLAIPLLSLAISSYFTGRKVGDDKPLMKLLISIGLTFISINLVWIALTEGIIILMLALFFSGIGIGMILPTLDALITESIEKEERGTVTSIYSSMRFVGVALGPPFVAISLSSGRTFIFFSMTIITILSLLAVLWLIHPEPKNEKQLKTS